MNQTEDQLHHKDNHSLFQHKVLWVKACFFRYIKWKKKSILYSFNMTFLSYLPVKECSLHTSGSLGYPLRCCWSSVCHWFLIWKYCVLMNLSGELLLYFLCVCVPHNILGLLLLKETIMKTMLSWASNFYLELVLVAMAVSHHMMSVWGRISISNHTE